MTAVEEFVASANTAIASMKEFCMTLKIVPISAPRITPKFSPPPDTGTLRNASSVMAMSA